MVGERDQEMSDGARQTRAEIAIGKLEVSVTILADALKDLEASTQKSVEERRAWQDTMNLVFNQIRMDTQRSADAFTGHLAQSKDMWADAKTRLDNHEERLGIIEKAIFSKIWLQDGWKFIIGISGWIAAIASTLHFLKVIP